MRMSSVVSSLFVCAAVFAGVQNAFAGALDELNDADQNRVKKGDQVAVFQDVANAPWPKCFIYQRIEATPEEAAAVFADYNHHEAFIPNVKQSSVSREINKTTVEVDYSLSLPLGLGSETYTVRDRVSTYDRGAGYKIEWTLVRADSTKSSDGNIRFEPLGNGTLMVYTSFIVPGRMGSSLKWVVDGAKNSVKETAQAVANQVEKERLHEPNRLQNQVQSLRGKLN
jgi:hypothetical protein